MHTKGQCDCRISRHRSASAPWAVSNRGSPLSSQAMLWCPENVSMRPDLGKSNPAFCSCSSCLESNTWNDVVPVLWVPTCRKQVFLSFLADMFRLSYSGHARFIVSFIWGGGYSAGLHHPSMLQADKLVTEPFHLLATVRYQ